MSKYLLVLLLLVLLMVSCDWRCHRQRPSFALIFPMLISACVVICFQSVIQYEISLLAVTVLFVMMCFFVLGEFSALIVDRSITRKTTFFEIRPSLAFKRLSLLVVLVNFILQLNFIRDVGNVYGAADLLSSYAANRLNTLELQQTGMSKIDPPGYISLVSVLATGIEILCLHILLLDKLKLKKTKVDKYLLFTVIIYFASLFFNSGRAAFVPVVVHLFYLVLRFSNKSLSSLIKTNKVLFSIAGAIIFTLFLLLGNLREKSSLSGDVNFDVDGNYMTALYIGGPLVGFDIYVNKGMPPYDNKGFTRNEYIGQGTFKEIYNVLRKFGIDTKRPVLHEEKFYLKEIEANVYTGFCHLIRDFGLYGSLLFMFVIGAVISHLDVLVQKNRIGYDNVIGLYTMSWIYFSLLAMFYTNEFYFLFSVDYFVYRVFLLLLFVKFGVKRTKIKLIN